MISPVRGTAEWQRPQVVVRALLVVGCLEGRHAHAQRRGAREHPAHGAVLAAGVHALQHQQQLALAFGVQQVLQLVELDRQRVDLRALRGLVALAEGRVVGVDVREPELAADAVFLEAGHVAGTP
jgi:hypothetical protein